MSYLIDLIRSGKISPNKGAHWIELQNGEFKSGIFDILSFIVDGKQTGFYIPKYSKLQKLIIAKNRKLLNMEPLEDYYKKFLYTLNNPESRYHFLTIKNKFEMPKELVDSLTAGMIELTDK